MNFSTLSTQEISSLAAQHNDNTQAWKTETTTPKPNQAQHKIFAGYEPATRMYFIRAQPDILVRDWMQIKDHGWKITRTIGLLIKRR